MRSLKVLKFTEDCTTNNNANVMPLLIYYEINSTTEELSACLCYPPVYTVDHSLIAIGLGGGLA